MEGSSRSNRGCSSEMYSTGCWLCLRTESAIALLRVLRVGDFCSLPPTTMTAKNLLVEALEA